MSLEYRGKRIRSIGFVGFGRSNRAVYAYLSRKYPEIKFTVRSQDAIKNLPTDCPTFFDKDELSSLTEDLIFLSPTVRRDRREIKECEDEGRVTSDARFFYDNTSSVCYSVTGSDGKSTTSAITALLLRESGIAAEAIGNIGEAMTPHLDFPSTRYVTELSSFQLMDFAPKARRAAILNITPNHLDWHRSYEEYKNAKGNAVLLAEERVFSLDSPELLSLIKGKTCFALFSSRLTLKEMLAYPARVYYHLDGGFICRSGKRILPIGSLLRQEEHFIRNFLAALSLSDGDTDPAATEAVASTFSGLSHRCELVHSGCGIDFYDSSIDSSPERTKTTLKSFLRNHVLILGGKSKGLDYGILKGAFKEYTKAIVITGENRFEIAEAISDTDIPVYIEYGFTEAVTLAARLARGFGAVLLSPASTSFDRFSNFEERGLEFLKIVRSL